MTSFPTLSRETANVLHGGVPIFVQEGHKIWDFVSSQQRGYLVNPL